MAQFDESNSDNLSLISSDGTRVCICNGSCPDYTIFNYTLIAYPGQTVLITVEPPNRGHFVTVAFVLSSEVASFQRLSNVCNDIDIDNNCDWNGL